MTRQAWLHGQDRERGCGQREGQDPIRGLRQRGGVIPRSSELLNQGLIKGFQEEEEVRNGVRK